MEREQRSHSRATREPGNEPVEVVLRRFFREVQQSGVMTEIKDRRYFKRTPSRNARQISAQERERRRKLFQTY